MTSTQRPINVLLVDDEQEACDNLKNILTEYVDSDINIVGVAYNTREAEQQIAKYAPDAVFLDIEMPNENAFAFLDRIAPHNFEVIFVTAYDEYAVKAFKLNAVDYILKPISIPELKNAVEKLRQKIQFRQVIAGGSSNYSELFSLKNNRVKIQKITLKDAGNIEVVDLKNIYFLEAQGSYSRVLFNKDSAMKEITMSTSLSDYEDMLPSDIFYRIHKSYLINCKHVKKILRDDHQVVMQAGNMLPVSRRRFTALIDFLKNNYQYEE